MGQNGKGIGARPAYTSLLCIIAVTLVASSSESQPVPGLDGIRVASGLTAPLFVTAPPGDYNRLFIVQQNGVIRILDLTTDPPLLKATPFLTIPGMGGGEQGLLGLAFHPSYDTNGKFYVLHVVSGGNDIRLAQYQISGNPDVADVTPANIKTVLTFTHPQSNHNAGWLGFSPRPGDENNLYISSGDGGGGNDQDTGHIEPGGNAQNNTTLLGKILRITPDPATGTYTIPSDNPFFGSADPLVKQEIWLLGLRNPYRDSFDRLTGRFFMGDVGQGSREEIDVQQPSNPGGGENYGWRLREGTIQTPGAVGGPPPPGNVEPIFDYRRTGTATQVAGRTVVGGYIYRGKQIPALNGVYVFADYLGPNPSPAPTPTPIPANTKKIYTLNYDGGLTASNPQDITSQLFPTSTGNFSILNPSSFGEDANGELYITDISAGSVYKIIPVTPNVELDSVMRIGTTFVLHGYGVPFQMHTIRAVTDITQPFDASKNIGTVTAAGDGSFQFTDASASTFGTRFYRVVYP